LSATLVQVNTVRRASSTEQITPEGGFLTGTALARFDFVTIDSNGRVTLAAASNANVGAIRIGRATNATAAAVATGTLIPIEILDEKFEVSLPLTTGGSTVAWNVNMVSKQYELRNNGGVWCVDTSATTNKALEIVGLDPNTPSGDAFPAVICKILPAFRLA